MDRTALASRARFAIGDRVRLQAGITWTVIGRYYRRRTRQIVYDLKDPRTGYVTRQPEERVYGVREEGEA